MCTSKACTISKKCLKFKSNYIVQEDSRLQQGISFLRKSLLTQCIVGCYTLYLPNMHVKSMMSIHDNTTRWGKINAPTAHVEEVVWCSKMTGFLCLPVEYVYWKITQNWLVSTCCNGNMFISVHGTYWLNTQHSLPYWAEHQEQNDKDCNRCQKSCYWQNHYSS